MDKIPLSFAMPTKKAVSVLPAEAQYQLELLSKGAVFEKLLPQ